MTPCAPASTQFRRSVAALARPWAIGLLVSGALLAASTAPATAAVTFIFDYTGGANGFNDPVHGTARRSALESAASTLGSWFDHQATIHIEARAIEDSNDDTLAFAGSAFSVFSGFRGYLTGTVGQKLASDGALDANGISADGELTVNFGHSWDLDDQIDPGAYDFKSTVMHEMLHAIGFASGINGDGSDIWGVETPNESTPGGGSNGGIWSPFDDFLVDVDGNAIINDTEFHIDLTNWTSDSTGGAGPDGGLFFDGPNARAANDGDPVALYTPNAFSTGSSVSHLDTDYKPFEDYLMAHTSQPGANARTLSPVEKGILTDLGFRIIPEPSSIALLLAASCLALQRRRRLCR